MIGEQTMSEVIVRMEMPLKCEHCPMSHWNKLNELTGCDAVGGKRYVSDDDEFWHMARPAWCPIVREIVPCDECVHSALASAGCCMYDSNVCISGERSET